MNSKVNLGFTKKILPIRKPFLLFCFLLLTHLSYSQSLDQHVIGSAGNFSATSSSTTLSWTVGEMITTTESSGNAILTQGFQQPVLVNPLSINSTNPNAFSLQVFPNPSLEQITIQKDQKENLKAELIDILGQVIGQYSLQDSQTQIDLSQLPSANYLLRIRSLDNEPLQTFKIQKI